MKKLMIFTVAIFMAFILLSCLNSQKKSAADIYLEKLKKEFNQFRAKFQKYDDSLKNVFDETEKQKAISKTKYIPVGEENFDKLVSFIEKNGFVEPEYGNVPCDFQYNFIDSKGNLHGFITIKRDENGNPSVAGKVIQITVYGYRGNIKDQEHFFGYIITRKNVVPHALDIDGKWNDADNVKTGYEEFLLKVKVG